jgi:hypothetical protein
MKSTYISETQTYKKNLVFLLCYFWYNFDLMLYIRGGGVRFVILSLRLSFDTKLLFFFVNYEKVLLYRGADRSLSISRCCCGDLIGRTNFWIYIYIYFYGMSCKSYSNGLSCILSFVGSILNKSRVWSL